MKIRIADRILVTVAGLVLLALAAGIVAQTLFAVDLLTMAQNELAAALNKNWQATKVIAGAAALLLALLGLYCLGMLIRHQKKNRRGFVMQQTDCGELSISIRAIEGLVQKCVDRHEEIQVMSTSLDSARDGLIIKLRIGLAGGVNIPLAVSALQKQIKQYVTSCSGVDVQEVKVQVETSVPKGKKSRYEMPEVIEKAVPLPLVQEPLAEAEKAQAEEEKRPLHQRVFGCGEQPANMPQPLNENAQPPVEAHSLVQEAQTVQEAAAQEEPRQEEAAPVQAEALVEEAPVQEADEVSEDVPEAEAEETCEESEEEETKTEEDKVNEITE